MSSAVDHHGGFLSALFDFEFKHFVALRIAGVMYGLGIVGMGLYALVGTVMAWEQLGLWTIPLVGLGFLLGIVLLRVWIEMLIAMIRVAESTSEITTVLERVETQLGGRAA